MTHIRLVAPMALALIGIFFTGLLGYVFDFPPAPFWLALLVGVGWGIFGLAVVFWYDGKYLKS